MKVEVSQISTLAHFKRAQGPHREMGQHSYNLRCAKYGYWNSPWDAAQSISNLASSILANWPNLASRIILGELSGPQRKEVGSPGVHQTSE